MLFLKVQGKFTLFAYRGQEVFVGLWVYEFIGLGHGNPEGVTL